MAALESALEVFQYVFEDGLDAATISFRVDESITKRTLSVQTTSTTISAGVKGKEPIIQGRLYQKIDPDTMWQIEGYSKGKVVTIHIEKESPTPWPLCIAGPKKQGDWSTIDGQSEYNVAIHMMQCGFTQQIDPALQIPSSDPQEIVKDAYKTLHSSAAKGSTFSQIRLYEMIKQGKELSGGIVTEEKHEALNFLAMAATGCSDVAKFLSVGVDQDLPPMERGNSEAQYIMGTEYLEGTLVEKSVFMAGKWFAVSGEQGNPRAAYQLGLLYHTGPDNWPRDPAKVMSLWHMSSEKGDAIATFNLGILFLNGTAATPPDLITSRKFFEKAVALAPHQFEIPAELLRAEALYKQLSQQKAQQDQQPQKAPSSTPLSTKTPQTTQVTKEQVVEEGDSAPTSFSDWIVPGLIGGTVCVAVAAGLYYAVTTDPPKPSPPSAN